MSPKKILTYLIISHALLLSSSVNAMQFAEGTFFKGPCHLMNSLAQRGDNKDLAAQLFPIFKGRFDYHFLSFMLTSFTPEDLSKTADVSLEKANHAAAQYGAVFRQYAETAKGLNTQVSAALSSYGIRRVDRELERNAEYVHRVAAARAQIRNLNAIQDSIFRQFFAVEVSVYTTTDGKALYDEDPHLFRSGIDDARRSIDSLLVRAEEFKGEHPNEAGAIDIFFKCLRMYRAIDAYYRALYNYFDLQVEILSEGRPNLSKLPADLRVYTYDPIETIESSKQKVDAAKSAWQQILLTKP